MGLKVFEASYYKSFGYGAYDEGKGIVVANTESEALGVCLQGNPETDPDGWDFDEVDVSKVYESVSIVCN